MQDEKYEDPRWEERSLHGDYEDEQDAAIPQTRYARDRRMKEKDEWYSILDEEK